MGISELVAMIVNQRAHGFLKVQAHAFAAHQDRVPYSRHALDLPAPLHLHESARLNIDSTVVRGVLAGGLKLVAAGVALGALALTGVLTSMLYEVSPTDPAVFVATCAAVVAVALVACYVPARSATRVDPMVILRTL
jgi:hypothetical protein